MSWSLSCQTLFLSSEALQAAACGSRPLGLGGPCGHGLAWTHGLPCAWLLQPCLLEELQAMELTISLSLAAQPESEQVRRGQG